MVEEFLKTTKKQQNITIIQHINPCTYSVVAVCISRRHDGLIMS